MSDDPAQMRFMLINLARISGLAVVFLALAIYYRKIDLPVELSYALAAIGMVWYFGLPKYLARKWRSPDK